MIEFEESLEADVLAAGFEAETTELAQQALEIFIKASLACPASVTAQAAYIALALRDVYPRVVPEHFADDLRIALINDQSRIRKIAKIGDAQHRKKGVDQKTLEFDRLDKVTYVVDADFDKADLLLRALTREHTQEIVDLAYPYYHARRRDPKTGLLRIFPEDSIREDVDQMMHGKLSGLAWRKPKPQPGVNHTH